MTEEEQTKITALIENLEEEINNKIVQFEQEYNTPVLIFAGYKVKLIVPVLTKKEDLKEG